MMEVKTYRFDEITTNFDKKRIPLSGAEREKRRGKYRYYGAQGVIDYIDDYIFDGTYLLIAEDGENLKSKKQNIAQIATGQFWVNNHAHIVQGNELCDTQFLCYLLNSMDLFGYVTGSAQPKLSQANLNAIMISLPKRAVQLRIVDYLLAIDRKIEVNNYINNNLEQQAQALFKAWFIDFLPFNGVIPSQWSIVPLGSLAKISTEVFSPQKNPNVEVEHYSIPAYDENHYPVFEISDGIKSNKYKLTANSVIISKLNPETKRIWRPYCLSSNPICSTEFIVYEPILSFHRDFLYSVIDSSAFSAYLCSHTTGSTNSRQRATPSITLNYEIAFPNEEVLKMFCETVTPMYETMASNLIENQKLVKTRDTLLPRLMSGELDVSDIKL